MSSTTTATAAAADVAMPRRRMSIWRLEWLRLTRSRGALVLGAVYLAFGFLGPVLALYLQDLVKLAQSDISISVPAPTVQDGIAEYISQVSQIGLIVVVAVAAGALTFDARRGLSTFLRTRARSMWMLIGPRAAVTAAAAVAAYALGTLAAWYETTMLIGDLSAGAVIEGLLCGSAYLVFAVAVVCAAASMARNTLGAVGTALAFLLLLPLAGTSTAVHAWLPSTLVGAPIDLLGTAHLSDYAPALVAAATASAALVTLAVERLKRREV